ncbi:hypothetical protein L2E82_24752 [Cichorium intybus]|uniref:Uncharacterized protein n=1 Tax=Cichorium intybus TaxID=13427 RepID=A0ACB9E1S4_CICIN|nr:hypothetical protein L2E82_24752 [Cichorium intybus]
MGVVGEFTIHPLNHRLYDASANVTRGDFLHGGAVLDFCFHDDTSGFSANADNTITSEEDKEAHNSQQSKLEMEIEGKNSKNDGDKEKKKEKSASAPTVGFRELFRFADGLDYVFFNKM